MIFGLTRRIQEAPTIQCSSSIKTAVDFAAIMTIRTKLKRKGSRFLPVLIYEAKNSMLQNKTQLMSQTSSKYSLPMDVSP